MGIKKWSLYRGRSLYVIIFRHDKIEIHLREIVKFECPIVARA